MRRHCGMIRLPRRGQRPRRSGSTPGSCSCSSRCGRRRSRGWWPRTRSCGSASTHWRSPSSRWRRTSAPASGAPLFQSVCHTTSVEQVLNLQAIAVPRKCTEPLRVTCTYSIILSKDTQSRLGYSECMRILPKCAFFCADARVAVFKRQVCQIYHVR